jgi:hypothetical protein
MGINYYSRLHHVIWQVWPLFTHFKTFIFCHTTLIYICVFLPYLNHLALQDNCCHRFAPVMCIYLFSCNSAKLHDVGVNYWYMIFTFSDDNICIFMKNPHIIWTKLQMKDFSKAFLVFDCRVHLFVFLQFVKIFFM